MNPFTEYRLGSRSLYATSFRGIHLLDFSLLRAGYAVLFPATAEVAASESDLLMLSIARRGAAEFCLAGPESDIVHDRIDGTLEDFGLTSVTTSMIDEREGIEYFLFGAGGGQCDLLALTLGFTKLHSILLSELELVIDARR